MKSLQYEIGYYLDILIKFYSIQYSQQIAFFVENNFASLMFLAVQNSSIGDLVTDWLTN